jgi:hypothetical protein
MISVIPSYPGPMYSSKVPTVFAKVSLNFPSAGSSGITTTRDP